MSRKFNAMMIACEISDRARSLSEASMQLNLLAQLVSLDSESEKIDFERRWPAGRSQPSVVMTNDKLLAGVAQTEYRDRALRNEFFAPVLFGEPGWDILLDLFIARVQGKVVPVTSAAVASRAPLTTALRWITMLEREGLIVRSDCKADARRSNLHLTELGMSKMRDFCRRKTLTLTPIQ